MVYETITDPNRIDITPNEVYGITMDGIETAPNDVYGIIMDRIETAPNEVYGDGNETSFNEIYYESIH